VRSLRDGPEAGTEPSAARFAAQLGRVRVPARLAYVGIILLATLSSLNWDLDAGAVAERIGRMLRPAVSGIDIVDGARNLVLFAGWGLLWMITTGPGRSWIALRNAVVTAAALSLSVEGLQLLSDTRVASVLDVATNTGGALAGALVSVLLVIGLAEASGARSFVGIPASIFAIPYGCAVLAEAFVPLFRQELEILVSGGALQRLATALGGFRWATLLAPPIGDFLLFLPAGALCVAWLHEGGRAYRTSALITGFGAAAALVAVEIAHGGIGIQIHGGAVLTHIAAVATGAWLAAIGLPHFTRSVRGVDRPRLLTLVYGALIVLWSLRPFRVETSLEAVVAKLASEWWIPLRFLGMRLDLFSVVDVLAPFLIYLPLGALLAVWPVRRYGRLAGFAPAIYLACATELIQILVAQRTLAITDLMIQATAVAVGWVAVRRAGFRPHGAQLPPRRAT